MYSFTKDEINAIEDFQRKHGDCYKKTHTRSAFTINTNATGIGTYTTITCDCCGEKKNITDYNVW